MTTHDTGKAPHQGGPNGLVVWLILVVAAVGMLVSTPPSGGPDEPQHEITAWYLSGHGFRPAATETFTVPSGFLPIYPCFAHRSGTTLACEPPPAGSEATTSTDNVLAYPPPYYWVVGAGERFAAAIDPAWAPIGGRLASFLLNLGALLLLGLYMRQRGSWWGAALLAICTPMAVFLDAVVNPSGWEITCGIIMAAGLWETIAPSQSTLARLRATTTMLALASLGLCLARPIGFIWAGGLTLSALALAPAFDRRTTIRVAAAVAPGIALGMLWYVTHPVTSIVNPGVISGADASLGPVEMLLVALFLFPHRLYQMFGDLGWLDTLMPVPLALAEVVAWAVLLRRMPTIGRAGMFLGVCGIVLGPAIIESTTSVSAALWWQGRYTMPFALGFFLLLLLRSGWLARRTLAFVGSLSVFATGAMVWLNMIRYNIGVGDFGLPQWTAPPAMQPIAVALSVAIGGALIATSVLLFLRTRRMPPDGGPAARAIDAAAGGKSRVAIRAATPGAQVPVSPSTPSRR